MEVFPDKVSTNQGLLRSRYRFVIAGLLLLANLVLGLNLFAASPIVPLIIEDYGVSRAAAGLREDCTVRVSPRSVGQPSPLLWVAFLGG